LDRNNQIILVLAVHIAQFLDFASNVSFFFPKVKKEKLAITTTLLKALP